MNIQIDSRKVKPGDMFFALKGLKKDLCALPFVGGISGWLKMRILLFAMWIPKAVALIRLYA